MRGVLGGFAVGSLALIVLYTVVQQGAAQRISAANTAASGAFARLLSPSVAGVPNRAGDTGSSAGSTIGGAAASAGQVGGQYAGGAIAGGAAGGAIAGGVHAINRGPLPVPNTGPAPGN